jgi:hypothetical protein
MAHVSHGEAMAPTRVRGRGVSQGSPDRQERVVGQLTSTDISSTSGTNSTEAPTLTAEVVIGPRGVTPVTGSDSLAGYVGGGPRPDACRGPLHRAGTVACPSEPTDRPTTR